MENARTKNRLVFLLLLAVSLTGYFPALKGGFVFDDRSLVIDNADIRSFAALPGLFFHNVHRYSPAQKSQYYRPLQAVTYSVDHALWGFEPLGYHLTNVALHVLAAFLIYRLLLALLFPFAAAVFAAFFFVAHPVHLSTVAYISGRADILVVLSVSAGCLAFVRYLHGGGKGVFFAAHAAFLAGLLSRENALLGPLFFLAAGWASGASVTRALRASVGFAGMAALYAVLHVHFSGPAVLISVGASDIPDLVNVLRHYAALIVWPWPLYPMHATPRVASVSLTDVIFAVSASCLMAACFLIDRRRGSRRLSFAVLWVIIALLPLPGLIHSFPRLGLVMAENWLYLPAAGLAALAGLACSRSGRAGFAAGAFILACLAAALFAASGTWKDEVTLYRHALRFSPQNPNIRTNLGAALFDRGDLAGAARLAQETIEQNPAEWAAHLLLGNVYYVQGDFAASEAVFRHTVELRPGSGRAWGSLGQALQAAGKKEEATAAFVKASEMDPLLWQPWRSLGDLALNRGDFVAAAAAYEHMASLRPSDAIGEVSYGIALGSLGRTGEAKRAFERALRIDPRSVDALKNLGVTLANEGKRREAVALWKRAIKLSPDDAELRRYLGENAGATPPSDRNDREAIGSSLTS